jgi:hypothetical protein
MLLPTILKRMGLAVINEWRGRGSAPPSSWNSQPAVWRVGFARDEFLLRFRFGVYLPQIDSYGGNIEIPRLQGARPVAILLPVRS